MKTRWKKVKCYGKILYLNLNRCWDQVKIPYLNSTFAPFNNKSGVFFMINLSGRLVENDQANISVQNRGFTYGDSVFETIRVINGKIMFWEDHYFRLMASMRIMRIEIPVNFSPEFIEEEILNLILL